LKSVSRRRVITQVVEGSIDWQRRAFTQTDLAAETAAASPEPLAHDPLDMFTF
jgi:hypothetical protein